MFRATIKGLLAKKFRLILTAISVVLGVGFVAGTYVLTDTMNAAFDDLFATTSAASDVTVRAKNAFDAEQAGPGGSGTEGRNPIPEELLDTVLAVPTVAAASGDVSGYAQLVNPNTGEAIGGDRTAHDRPELDRHDLRGASDPGRRAPLRPRRCRDRCRNR